MRKWVDVYDCYLKVNEGVALLNSVNIEIVELLFRNIDKEIRLASVETLFDIIFEELKANFR